MAMCETPDWNKTTRELFKLNEQIQKTLTSQNLAKNMPVNSMTNIYNAFWEGFKELSENPKKLSEASNQFMADTIKLWQELLTTGQMSFPTNDKRFKDPLWAQTPASAFIMQSYLLYAKWVESIADDMEGLNEDAKRKIKFYSRQFVDAISPSNFAWANPIVMKKTLETHGENLITGMTRFLEDLQNGTSLVNIKNTDRGAFEIGKDLAATPGKVIFQNEMMQLIQYTPTTNKVYKTPVLVVPAWINKFYILDLQPKNSFVRWLVEQGHTVFIISWVNPGRAHVDVNFDAYLMKGSLEAIRVIQEIAGEKSVNLIGFCLGGISLSVLMGYLQKEAKKTVNSLTLMAAPLDFSQAGELTIFLDEDYMSLISSKLKDIGLLDGAAMGATFNMLRANDLIWSAFINNYLLANDQPQFDMLYWNADTTNLPSKMFNYYIQEICLKNGLMNPDSVQLLDKKINISKAQVPMFLFGAHDDHIAPWKSMYAALSKLHGPVKFVLGGSGHVAGVINHPDQNKYGHWENNSYVEDPNEWLNQATYSNDSWWLAWKTWIETFADEQIDSKLRAPGKGPYKALENAPGSYVKVTSEQALQSKR